MFAETKPSQRRNKIPERLFFEKIDGKSFYYKGYKEVLRKKREVEDVRSINGLQAFIISYLLRIFHLNIKTEKYSFLSNRVGVFIDDNSIISCDIFVFGHTQQFLSKIATSYYLDIAPKIAIEIDIRVDLSDEKDFGYVFTKTHKLLDFGVEKVFWIFTKHQKVMIAVKDEDWITKDWNQEIELLDNEFFNIGQFLADEGIKP